VLGEKVLCPDPDSSAQGWVARPDSDGTRFTKDGTGHGMFVSIENVYAI
jgi:hypothetical protein